VPFFWSNSATKEAQYIWKYRTSAAFHFEKQGLVTKMKVINKLIKTVFPKKIIAWISVPGSKESQSTMVVFVTQNFNELLLIKRPENRVGEY
jgi:hypothetical protein